MGAEQPITQNVFLCRSMRPSHEKHPCNSRQGLSCMKSARVPFFEGEDAKACYYERSQLALANKGQAHRGGGQRCRSVDLIKRLSGTHRQRISPSEQHFPVHNMADVFGLNSQMRQVTCICCCQRIVVTCKL